VSASVLDNVWHRTCEHCGVEAARFDALHLCGCDEQMNCCGDCRANCRADNTCGLWFYAQWEGERFPLLYQGVAV